MATRVNFNDCKLPFLEETFGLRMVLELPILTAWLQDSQHFPVSEIDQIKLNDLQDLLLQNVFNWNEQELSMHFIGPIFSMVRFGALHRYNLFAHRFMKVIVEEYELAGEPDEVIASGYFEPKIPYFVFAEYKRERDPNGDPAGQALAAMLAGQTLNMNQHPIYGAYVIGREWFFMALQDKHYAISRGHNALQPDELADILRILKAMKKIVEDRSP